MASEDLAQLAAVSGRLDQIAEAFRSHEGAFLECFMALPCPAWVKSADGTMILSNRAYEVAFGVKPEAYAATRDADHWPLLEATAYGKNDEEVVRSGRPVVRIEHIRNPARDDLKQQLVVQKYPVAWNADGRVTAVAGVVLYLLPID